MNNLFLYIFLVVRVLSHMIVLLVVFFVKSQLTTISFVIFNIWYMLRNENNNFDIKNHLALPKKFMKLRKQLDYITYPVMITVAFAKAKSIEEI